MIWLLIFTAIVSIVRGLSAAGRLGRNGNEISLPRESCSELTCPLVFVTYFTANIANHSLCTHSINSAYASYHNSSVLVVNEDVVNLDWDTNDVRWNKVIVLKYILDNYPIYPVIIWLDSDLIINHFNFSFLPMLQTHPNSDIIISREINPKNGVINTGCMILRNTKWTLAFLDLWWNQFNRNDGMDQHIFTALYHSLPGAPSHIALLPPSAINSVFPGLTTYQDKEPILHLAGESNFIRSHIFCTAWEQYNHTVSSESSDHIFVTRGVLDGIDYVQLHREEWDRIIDDIGTLLNNTQLELLNEMRYRIREVQQSAAKSICFHKKHASMSNDSCQSIKNIFKEPANNALFNLFQLFSHHVANHSIVRNLNAPDTRYISLLQSALDSGLEYLLVSASPTQFSLVLSHLEQYMAILLDTTPILHKDSIPSLYYYQFKILEFKANGLSVLPEPQSTLENYLQAWTVWMKLKDEYNYFGAGNGVMNQYEEGVRIGMKMIKFALEYDVFNEKVKGVANVLKEVLQGEGESTLGEYDAYEQMLDQLNKNTLWTTAGIPSQSMPSYELIKDGDPSTEVNGEEITYARKKRLKKKRKIN